MDTCRICNQPLQGGINRKTGRYHKECLRMQDRGLLSTGAPRPVKDSTGSRCCGCNTMIEAGEQHAHRLGRPFHRECLI